jgi:hypothetical protein
MVTGAPPPKTLPSAPTIAPGVITSLKPLPTAVLAKLKVKFWPVESREILLILMSLPPFAARSTKIFTFLTRAGLMAVLKLIVTPVALAFLPVPWVMMVVEATAGAGAVVRVIPRLPL